MGQSASGQGHQFAVVEGVQEHELRTGPGRYPDTQLPGQDGNFATAGHRVGKGAPFNDLGALEASCRCSRIRQLATTKGRTVCQHRSTSASLPAITPGLRAARLRCPATSR